MSRSYTWSDFWHDVANYLEPDPVASGIKFGIKALRKLNEGPDVLALKDADDEIRHMRTLVDICHNSPDRNFVHEIKKRLKKDIEDLYYRIGDTRTNTGLSGTLGSAAMGNALFASPLAFGPAAPLAFLIVAPFAVGVGICMAKEKGIENKISTLEGMLAEVSARDGRRIRSF
jgi:hypothetical protein